MNVLKNHPFAVEAFFERTIVLTFAVPKEALKHRIPKGLRLDIYGDRWAFLAVALVDTKYLRPKGFPKILGQDFFLIGYRIFTRFTNTQGKHYRGLYILRSETDKWQMQYLGNLFTHYQYHYSDIKRTSTGEQTIISSSTSDFKLIIDQTAKEVSIPKHSPFTDWKTARKYAGPLPFTFTVFAEQASVLIVQGVRQDWKPKPIKIDSYHFVYLQQFNLPDMVLASAFEIKNVPYYWKKGRIEKWQ